MLLENYYTIIDRVAHADGVMFTVALNPDCKVYEGHFPQGPVSPGVCNIQMLLECAAIVAGKTLRLTQIKQCRLTTLITPQKHPILEAFVCLLANEDNSFSLNAILGKGEEVYMTLKAELR